MIWPPQPAVELRAAFAWQPSVRFTDVECPVRRPRSGRWGYGFNRSTQRIVMQRKTERPVQFEIAVQTRESLSKSSNCVWLEKQPFATSITSRQTDPF